MQIGISPEDWEEAGNSAEAKLIIEMDGWMVMNRNGTIHRNGE